MDQQALRELEFRCIQEEPPWCMAACPLHVDVRAFTRYIGRERWEDAWKVLHRYMPMPGILGRICDAPCECRCRRQDAGDSVRISDLERTCVQIDPPVVHIRPLPAKGKTVAIAGSGLSSLTVAWDLVRKGYAVTVFETGGLPGRPLRRFNPQKLSAEVIDREISVLTRLGVRFELGCEPDISDVAVRCLNSYDAVYLGLDALSGQREGAACDGGCVMRTDSQSGQTSRAGLFAGGQTASPVWQASEGRWAATSIDRFLQGVSITAGRNREGPFESRLFTSLKGVVPLPAVSAENAVSGFTRTEASAEARRCLQCECLVCVKVCAFMEQFGAYPKKYAREIYNNLSIVMGEHKANRLINSCSLCGLCEQVCPNDFPMQEICLQARRSMVKNGRMPPSAHEFALQDMAFSQSGRFAMARYQPGYEASTHVFFPGCQLCASAPEQVEKVYAHLCSVGSGGTGLMLDCCAAPAYWAGSEEQFEAHLLHITAQWEALGQPQMVLACSTCMRIFKEHLPMIQVVSLWSVLETHPLPPVTTGISRSLAIHDPCTTRYETGLQDCIRRLVAAAGLETEELTMSRNETECCGFGGLMQNANPDLAREVIRRRSKLSSSDYLTYCAMCRDSLTAAGKRVIHLLDIYFPDSRYPDPALRPRPGWSQRQENRARLRTHLLSHIWNEETDSMNIHSAIRLEISPEVAELLDSRRILTEDLQQVIRHAEISGERLFHPQTGHYKAAYASHNVTFWAEYSPAGEVYVIHNAYAHRMEVIGP